MTTRPIVRSTVWLLGVVSALTDISSEMISSVLPVYLLVHLQVSPVQFGVVDGLYQGITALTRLLSGITADRWRRYKMIAAIGYGLSAACKLGLLVAGGAWRAVAIVLSTDRVGKGIRTAPRDAMISLSTDRPHLATAFGVHRALDTAGVVIGPLIAFALLRLVPGRFDAVFVTSFAAAVIGLAVLVFLVDDSRAVADPHVDVDTASKGDLRALVQRRFMAMTAAAAVASFVVMSDAFLYLLLQWRTNIRFESIPLLYVGTATAYLIVAAPLGRLADRCGRGLVFVMGHVCLLVVYATVAWGGIGLPRMVLCLLLHGVYYASTDGVLAALCSVASAPEVRATGLSALATATSLARLGGSLAVGLVWAWQGPHAVAVAATVGVGLSIAFSTIVLTRHWSDRVAAVSA